MKRLRNILILLVSLFFLTSCYLTEWEEYYKDNVKHINVYRDTITNEITHLKVEIYLPYGTYDSVEEGQELVVDLRIQIQLVVYVNSNTKDYLYTEILVESLMEGTNMYYVPFDVSNVDSKYDNDDIRMIFVKSCEFAVRYVNPPLDVSNSMIPILVNGFLVSMFVYFTLIIVL